VRFGKDVAAAGGWKDVTTLIERYQQPDSETLRAVADFVGGACGQDRLSEKRAPRER
jgi:hypothetical protein